MGLKMKNFNIVGVYQSLGEGGHKKQYIGGNCLKRGLGQFPGGLSKKKGRGCFWGGGGGGYPDAHYDFVLVHTKTWDWTCYVSELNWSGSFL